MPESNDSHSTRSGLVCVGLNYKTTPVEVRERLAFPEAQVPLAVQQVRGLPLDAAKQGQHLDHLHR